jgi:hypothetical protein
MERGASTILTEVFGGRDYDKERPAMGKNKRRR